MPATGRRRPSKVVIPTCKGHWHNYRLYLVYSWLINNRWQLVSIVTRILVFCTFSVQHFHFLATGRFFCAEGELFSLPGQKDGQLAPSRKDGYGGPWLWRHESFSGVHLKNLNEDIHTVSTTNVAWDPSTV